MSGGEDQKRFGAGHVPAAGNHFTTLKRNGPAQQCNLGADGLNIRWRPSQTNRHTRGSGFIFIETSRAAQIVYDYIQVAVAIEIGESHGMVNAGLIGPPYWRDILELQITSIAEGDDWCVKPGIEPHVLHQFLGKGLLPIGFIAESFP